MQKVVKLNLEQLVPQAVEFELSSVKDKKLTLNAYTLRAQIWATKTFGGNEKLEYIMSKWPVDEMSQIAWFLLKEKDQFKNDYVNFLDGVITHKDRTNMVEAVLGSIGLSMPVLEDLAKQLEAQEPGNDVSPEVLTGANSTTN